LCPAMVEVEEPAPADPFALPTTRSEDLLRFNARASALQRMKLSGQIIYAQAGEYFMLDISYTKRTANCVSASSA
jgi:hypothetical protein